jgi:hypothetical protein
MNPERSPVATIRQNLSIQVPPEVPPDFAAVVCQNDVSGRRDEMAEMMHPKRSSEQRQADQSIQKVSHHKDGEQHTCVGEQQQWYGILKQLSHVRASRWPTGQTLLAEVLAIMPRSLRRALETA